MKICTFLWVYYGYPSSSYEGVSVEQMRYHCGAMPGSRDDAHPDTVAGVPDSGTAHAIGYANESASPSPALYQVHRHLAPLLYAHYAEPAEPHRQDEAYPGPRAHQDRSLLLIDDSIVRGTQLRETTEFLYQSGAREVHVRPASLPCCTDVST